MCSGDGRQDEYLVAYFDILGFKKYVERNRLYSVVSEYKRILQEIQNSSKPRSDLKGFSYHWFSDTFLFLFRLEEENFKCSFDYMMYLSKSFFHKMTLKRQSLRGAFTLGELYAEPKNNIFLGQALIEAHDYAENQDWLGFVLTPTIIERLKKLSCNSYERYFVQYKVPYKENKSRNLFALRLDKFNSGVNPRNSRSYDLWPILSIMERNAPKKAWVKYENTKTFMLNNCQPLRDIVQREQGKPVP